MWQYSLISYVYTGFKLGKSAIQLTEELQAVFGVDSAPCLRTVQLWIGAIKDGSFSFRKNVISGRPRSFRVPESSCKMPRISVRELARILNTDYTSIHRILTKNLQMKKLCSVWVPTVLSEKNKKDRIICCKRILKDVSVSKSDAYCVQDELWIYWDIERKLCCWYRSRVDLQGFLSQHYPRVRPLQLTTWWSM